MANVMMPQAKKTNDMGNLLTIGGAVVGGAFGGPAGAMTGAGAGQMAGGMLAQQSAPQAQQPVQSSAMQRRAESMQNLDQLRQSEQALAYLPPDQQQQYAPAIQRARIMAEKQNGVA